MTHLSDKFMLDMLRKVQPLQVELLKTGRTAHLDAHYYEYAWDEPDHTVGFELFIFEENELVKRFDFNAMDTEAEVEAVFVSLAAYVHSL